MSDTNLAYRHRRKPSTAVLLSLLLAGLGHIYCGQIVKGLVLAFLSGIFVPMAVGAMSIANALARGAVIFTSAFAALVIGLIAIIDSYYVARRTKADYQLKDYNRRYVYLIIVLMSTGSAAGFSFHVRAKFLQAFRYGGGAMAPTLVSSDRVLANKIAYDKSNPQRGDIVIFENPDNRQKARLIRRVVALEGDTVEFKDNQLYINGQKLPLEAVPESPLAATEASSDAAVFYEVNGQAKYKIILSAAAGTEPLSTDFAPITVPKRHCFVLGDNRNVTRDSRHYGPIHGASIVGRIDYLYLPAKDWSRFGRLQN